MTEPLTDQIIERGLLRRGRRRGGIQRAAIINECAYRGLQLIDTIEDGERQGGKDLKRPGVQIALETEERNSS
jgi:hypothetical protein